VSYILEIIRISVSIFVSCQCPYSYLCYISNLNYSNEILKFQFLSKFIIQITYFLVKHFNCSIRVTVLKFYIKIHSKLFKQFFFYLMSFYTFQKKEFCYFLKKNILRMLYIYILIEKKVLKIR